MEHNTELGRLLSEALQTEIAEARSLSQMEQAIRRRLMEIGRQALTHWLARLAEGAAKRTAPVPPWARPWPCAGSWARSTSPPAWRLFWSPGADGLGLLASFPDLV